MTTLYEKLFPAIMTLACDVEQVRRKNEREKLKCKSFCLGGRATLQAALLANDPLVHQF